MSVECGGVRGKAGPGSSQNQTLEPSASLLSPCTLRILCSLALPAEERPPSPSLPPSCRRAPSPLQFGPVGRRTSPYLTLPLPPPSCRRAPSPLQFGPVGRRTSPLPDPPPPSPLLQARTISPAVWCSRPDLTLVRQAAANAQLAQLEWFRGSAPLRTAYVRRQLFFPDRKLIQYDCGKLQV